MKNIILKTVVFIIMFTGTVFFVNKVNNRNYDKATREMDEATLPLVYCEFEGETINRLYGYTQVMSTALMRNAIVPLNEGYGVDLLVDDEYGYGTKYSYELRTIAGDSLVENGELELKGTDGYRQQFFVRFRMDMKPNREYVLVFIIENQQKEQARYYMRVVNIEEQHMKQFLDFAEEFHETSFEKKVHETEGNFVYDRLQTTGEGTNYNLSHVSLKSNYDMVSWGNLEPVIVSAIVPTITELDKEYGIVNYSYVVQSVQNGVIHYYNVDEYYSVLFDEPTKEIQLLGFDRYMESIFDSDYITKSRNGISMGIAGGVTEYLSSDENTKLAFVKEGQLWLYDYNVQKLVSVFRFTQGNYSDARNINTDVDINIAGMDDEGNIYFVVYGYMSRGDHQGKNGVSLYYYTEKDAQIQEKIFIECDEPFDVMEQEIGRFTYYDDMGHFFYLLDGAVYEINMNEMTQDLLVTGLSSDKILVSSNRKIVAYPNTDDDMEVTGIIIRNFETGQDYEESCGANERMSALGFVGDDLIYGVANKSDILVSSYGEAILPMKKLYVVEPGGQVIKEYSKNDMYIMDARVESEKVYLQRAYKHNNFFESAEDDTISYKTDENQDNINQSYYYDSYAMNVRDLVFPSDMYIGESAKLVMTKTQAAEEYKELTIKTGTREGLYYVFNDGGYAGAYRSAGKAIVSVAQDSSGLVVDENGNTVYRALAATGYNTVAEAIDEYPCKNVKDTWMTCAYMCIEYLDSEVEYKDVMQYDSWEDAFEQLTNGVGINISGIDLQTALYFLDRDVPFAACIDDGRYVLVISYNSTHIRYYDPILGEEVRVTRGSFENSLSMQSNTMYTYTSQ